MGKNVSFFILFFFFVSNIAGLFDNWGGAVGVCAPAFSILTSLLTGRLQVKILFGKWVPIRWLISSRGG